VLGQLGVQLGGGPARHGLDLRGQQREQETVLVRRPDRAVVAEERRPGRLLPAEADRAVQQAGDEPLEPDRHLDQPAAEVGHDPVDQRTGHQRLAHRRVLRPAGAVAEQVGDGDGEEVVGVHQAGVRRHDPVPVGVGVVAGGDLELVLAPHEGGHRRGRRAVHADLAVPVQRHEPPGGVDLRVDDGQVQAVPLGDGTPVVDAGPAERVGADPDAGLSDGLEVDDVRQVVDVGAQEVVALGVRPGLVDRYPPDAAEPGAQQVVGAAGDPSGGVGVGRAAARRVVLEAAVPGWVVRRGDDDPVGQSVGSAPVGREDRVADRGGGGVAVGRVDQDGHVVGREDLQSARPCRLGQGMGVPAEEERAVVPLGGPVLADRLGGGDDVRLVEGGVEAGAAVPRRPEHDLLVGLGRIRLHRVVRGDERGDVDQVTGLGGLSGTGVAHALILSVAGSRRDPCSLRTKTGAVLSVAGRMLRA
jgi:hypothetical protein